MKKRTLLISAFLLLCIITMQAGSGIYLRGGLNNWGATSNWEFVDEGGGIYTLADKEIYGQFKIGGTTWDEYDYGTGGGTLTLGTPFSLLAGGSNISCSSTFKCSKITFTLDGNGTATLLLEGDSNVDKELLEVYVMGDNNNWNFNDITGKLSATSNKGEFMGTVTMVAASGESVCYWRIYEYLGMGGSWGNPGGLSTSGNNTSGVLELNSEGCVTTSPGTYIVTFNINTGAYTCINVPIVASGSIVMPQNAVLVNEIPQDVKILSLNNSLIDYNNQFKIFNDIASQMAKKASWTTHTLLGQSLLTHYNEGESLTTAGTPSAKMMVRSEAWTHIILQEQSATPRNNIKEFRESVRLWKEYIRTNCPNPNAVIIIPMNWAYSDWSTFKADNKMLYENYMIVAQEQGVSICPVGIAYEAIYDNLGSEQCGLLYSDNRHPTLKASYLAACMEYSLIYNEPANTINFSPEALSLDEAHSMKEFATSVMTSFDNPVNHHTRKIKFSAKVVDQFGIPMEAAMVTKWSINGGGSLDDNHIFTSNGTLGKYNITATIDGTEKTAVLTVGKPQSITKDEPAVEISDDINVLNQNFDGIGSDAAATLPIGWRIDKQTNTPRTIGTFAVAAERTEQAGGNSIAPDAKNGIWNFGANNSSERAIGGISTGVANATRCVNVYFHIRNTGTRDIKGLKIAYDVEKYRKGSNGAGFATQLYYSVDGNNWTNAGNDFYTFFGKDNATEGYAEAPGETKNTNNMLDVLIKSGMDLYLAWNISVASGSVANAAQALAVDNFSLTVQDRILGIENIANTKKILGLTVKNGWLYVTGDSVVNINIYNLNGINVGATNTKNEINISDFNRGIYIVKVVTATKTEVFKINI